jgi:hypothetical protein
LKKGNNSLAASIPTLPGRALKGGGKVKRINFKEKVFILYTSWKA